MVSPAPVPLKVHTSVPPAPPVVAAPVSVPDDVELPAPVVAPLPETDDVPAPVEAVDYSVHERLNGVDLNTATFEQLMTLPGVTPLVARTILQGRFVGGYALVHVVGVGCRVLPASNYVAVSYGRGDACTCYLPES